MSEPEEWKGDAGSAVRNFLAAVQRAERNVGIAKAALEAAYDELKATERDLDTAKHVYRAAQQDHDRRVRTPRISQQKQEWLRVLAFHEVFGASEMREAAEKVSWSPTGNALRTLASEYRNAGYFIGISHGVMRMDRDRVSAAIGDIFGKRHELQTLNTPKSDEEYDIGTRSPEPSENLRSDGYQDYDDDVPF